MALPFLHEHELPESVRFEMQQEEEAQKASGANTIPGIVNIHHTRLPILLAHEDCLKPGREMPCWRTFMMTGGGAPGNQLSQ